MATYKPVLNLHLKFKLSVILFKDYRGKYVNYEVLTSYKKESEIIVLQHSNPSSRSIVRLIKIVESGTVVHDRSGFTRCNSRLNGRTN